MSKALGVITVVAFVLFLKGLSNPYSRSMSGHTVQDSSRKGVFSRITVLKSNPRGSVVQGTTRSGKTSVFNVTGNGLFPGATFRSGRVRDGVFSGQ